MDSLVKKERQHIMELFNQSDVLEFSYIQKQLKIRSNALSYHLDLLQKDGLLEKNDELLYQLTQKGIKYLPHFPQIMGKSFSPLPILLIKVMNEKKEILFIKRNMRPFKGMFSLIGGKLLHGESIFDGAKRIVLKKTNMIIKDIKLLSVAEEFVENQNHFLLFYLEAFSDSSDFSEKKYGSLHWKKNIPKNTIISDKRLLVEEQQHPMNLQTIVSKDSH